jgi:single-stranded DNA-binding protein
MLKKFNKFLNETIYHQAPFQINDTTLYIGMHYPKRYSQTVLITKAIPVGSTFRYRVLFKDGFDIICDEVELLPGLRKDNDKIKEEDIEWFESIKYLNENLENQKFFKKGDKVIVNGQVDGRKFENREGVVLEFSLPVWHAKKEGRSKFGHEYNIKFKNKKGDGFFNWWVNHENLSPTEEIKEDDIEWFESTKFNFQKGDEVIYLGDPEDEDNDLYKNQKAEIMNVEGNWYTLRIGNVVFRCMHNEIKKQEIEKINDEDIEWF